MGRDKALLPWPPIDAEAVPRGTFLSAAIQMLTPHVDVVLVVAGKNEGTLTSVAYAHGATLIVNPDPGQGQFSSLRIGLREVLNRGRDSAIITLVDRPPVQAETVRQLREAFDQAIRRGKWAIVPDYQGKHGHPMIAGRELIEAFLRASDNSNAREVEHAHQDKIEYLAVSDPLAAMNVDTPEQYAALSAPTR